MGKPKELQIYWGEEQKMSIYGGVEAGGTKFVCAVGSSPEQILAETRFPTTSPEETIARTADFFRRAIQKNRLRLDGIGIGGFGPLDLNPHSPNFGKITLTPKPGWQFTDILHEIQKKTGVPVALDTDVNTAALGEGRWGAAQDVANYVYLTIGTGIGGGLIVNRRPYHGLVHPEMGHIHLVRDPKMDPFEGICPFHGDCFEGLASGPALKIRYNQPAETLPQDHSAWDLESHYIAMALSDIICMVSPERIILGGGVMQQTHLFPMVRGKVQQLLNRYVQSPQIIEHIDDYIVPPQLGNSAGVLGAIVLAEQAFQA
jgi:fructokinase